jgi:hypothetical protein
MVLVMNGLPLNQDPALKNWFRCYYVKWLETCDNQRWVADGRAPKHPTALMPFIPFGVAPAVPYNAFLTAFIDRQICWRDDSLPSPLGFDGHMATLVVDNPAQPCPYIMIETVKGGVVTDFEMFRNVNWTDPAVAACLAAKGITRIYQKIVHTAFLRQLYQLHQQWLIDGDNARYLIGFVETLLKGMQTGIAAINPKPPMLANLETIFTTSVKLGPLDVWGALKKYAHLAPNIIIEGRGGDVPIDLGGKLAIVLTEDALLTLLDGFKFSTTLSELAAFLIGFAARGLREGEFKIAGARWAAKPVAWMARRRIRVLPKKIQIMTKIMGNPFRLLVFADCHALLVTFQDGLPAGIEYVDTPDPAPGQPPAPARERWLQVCRARDQFIHLSVQLRDRVQPSLSLSLHEIVDYYPRNDFVVYIMRKGALDFVFNLMAPFLGA